MLAMGGQTARAGRRCKRAAGAGMWAGARACWSSGRRRGRRAGRRWAQAWARRARSVGAAWARPGRAFAHGGQAGWVSWASLGFGEPGSVPTQFLTRF